MLVNFSAEGVTKTKQIIKDSNLLKEKMLKPEYTPEKPMADATEISVITDALSGYFKICAERLKFDLKAEQLLKNAYIGGLGIAYTYWDNNAPTGLFADYSKTHKINRK